VPQVVRLDLERALYEEALAFFEAARDGVAVPAARAWTFARACIERDVVGRNALAVLDGDAFVGARLLDLAELILSESGQVQGERPGVASCSGGVTTNPAARGKKEDRR